MKCLLNIGGGSHCRRCQSGRKTRAISRNMCGPSLDCDCKDAPFSLRALNPDGSAMERNQLLHQGQPNRRTLMSARLRSFYSVKTIEQTR